MEYWEFLIQKEGERSWQPIKPPKLEIEAGRYRVVVHSSRNNTDVEICVTHKSTGEVPPKRRSQTRSRRTNQEGLMVIIPFTYLKPGLWELRCCGDIMSDFLGNSWQHAVQLQVLPKVTEVLPTTEPSSPVAHATQKDIQADVSEQSSSNSNSDLAVEPAQTETETAPVIVLAAKEAIPGNRNLGLEIGDGESASSGGAAPITLDGENLESNPLTNQQPHHPITEVPSLDFDEAEALLASLADIAIPLEPAELDENRIVLNGNSAEVATPTNPILDQSLQMLEQILQQVLEPVLQEFDRSESPDSQFPVTPSSELPLEIDTHQLGLTLTLNEETFVARRGEALTITGKVDVLEVNQLSDRETSSASECLFQGTLRYELRDPQTSKVFLDVQQPLSQQALPLAFSHTLEIPPDCNTRLILGKVTLYGPTPAALATQPFSVTADLDELLGAIIPGTKAMPLAKVLVLANHLAASQENLLDLPEQDNSSALKQAFIDLLDVSQSPESFSLKRSSSQPLPPQIYQPDSTHRLSKSLQLPELPKIRPIVASAESSVAASTPNRDEVKPEDPVEQLPPVALADELSPEIPNQELADTAQDTTLESQPQEALEGSEDATSQEYTVTVADSSSSGLETTELSDSPVTVVDAGLDTLETNETPEALESTADAQLSTSEATETPESSESMADFQLSTSDATEVLATLTPAADSQASDSEALEWLDTTEPEMQSADVPVAQTVADERTVVDNAFQSLKIQDRFWSRLNSLAADTRLSQWLKSELPPSSNPTIVEDATQQSEPDTVRIEVEEVTQPLNSDTSLADFDESIWAEESENIGDAIAPPAEPQPTDLQENTSLEAEPQPPTQGIANTDWAAQEFVVDDEDLPAPEKSMKRREASGMVYSTRQLDLQPEPAIPSPIQFESPLPAPDLFIPASELPAGEPVTVRVSLPPHPARLCVKLWVQDRQSRSLLDGPRWLMDLIPDRAGEQQALTQLIVPFGSAEIRFEAITVDIDSQRESHKVAVDCVVVPPDLPNISLDEFEA